MSGYPDNNPKTAVGSSKIPLHLVPPSAKHYLAEAMADGARKYGPYNWRDKTISVSVYYDAVQRHWDAFWDGEDNAQDSNVHHLAHAMACCALVLDALSVGKLNDDRPSKGAVPSLQANYAAKKAINYGEIIPHNIAMAALRDKAMADDDAPGFDPITAAGAQSGTPISQVDEE